MSTQEFTALLTSNESYLHPFAFSLTRDTDKAKDLLQETMYRALVNKDKYSAGTNIKAWLFTILRNIFINDYRKQSRQRMVVSTTLNEYAENLDAKVYNKALVTLNVREIKAAIDRLPKLFKLPFMLHFEGYKYEEIAGMLKEPVGTIKSRIHFARKTLKAEVSLN